VVSIPVADQDRSLAFYRDALGFELVDESPMGPDMRWVQLRPAGAETSITLVTWLPAMTPGSLQGLVISVDDLEATYAAVSAAGVAVTDAIQDAPWVAAPSQSTTPTARA